LIRGWVPVFPRDKREAFARRSCSNKKIERDDDSKKSHRALADAVTLHVCANIRNRTGKQASTPTAIATDHAYTWIALRALRLDVRIESCSDLGRRSCEVRFTSMSRHREVDRLRPKSANNGSNPFHSITPSASARDIGGIVRLSAVLWGVLTGAPGGLCVDSSASRAKKTCFVPWGRINWLSHSGATLGPRAARPTAHG
jgi:hypothetical protein